MSATPRTVGLIGCGHWGRHILRDLRELGCAVPVVARSAESVARANAGGAERVVDSIPALGPCQGMVIAAPTDRHYAVIQESLAAFPDTPIFVEKPLVVEGHHIDALRPHAAQIFVMDEWRYHGGVLKLAELIRERTFGKLIGMRSYRCAWGATHDHSSAPWHLAPHDLSIVLECLGEIPSPRVAVADRIDGKICGMTALLGVDPWVHIEVSERWDQRFREIRCHFEDAIVVLPGGYAEALQVHRSDRWRRGEDAGDESLPFEPNMPLHDELAAFVAYLDGGPPPRSSFDEAATIVRTVETMIELA